MKFPGCSSCRGWDDKASARCLSQLSLLTLLPALWNRCEASLENVRCWKPGLLAPKLDADYPQPLSGSPVLDPQCLILLCGCPQICGYTVMPLLQVSVPRWGGGRAWPFCLQVWSLSPGLLTCWDRDNLSGSPLQHPGRSPGLLLPLNLTEGSVE